MTFDEFVLAHSGTLREQAERSVGCLEEWHARIVRHWADGAPGWAPDIATAVLGRSRLDRQTSLCGCLRLWLDPPIRRHADGTLILAWANLGALVEGTLKFFLSVYAHDYSKTPKRTGRGKTRDPDALSFEAVRLFFRDRVWRSSQDSWDGWLQCVQWRRNAIHAYQHTEIGAHAEFLCAIVGYRQLAHELNEQIPWWSSEEGPLI